MPQPPQPSNEERREFQRLRLDRPVAGFFGSTDVTIVEAGVLGARIQHNVPLDSTRGDLQFSWRDNRVVMRCEVVRTTEGVPLVSGVRFLAAVGESGDHLRAMLAQLVAGVLERRYEMSATRLRSSVVDGDKTVRGRDAQFVSYRLDDGAWRRRPVFLPEQPAAGFTVAHFEDGDELQRLCAAYESTDAEGRRLIRLFAELSVSDALQIPPSA